MVATIICYRASKLCFDFFYGADTPFRNSRKFEATYLFPQGVSCSWFFRLKLRTLLISLVFSSLNNLILTCWSASSSAITAINSPYLAQKLSVSIVLTQFSLEEIVSPVNDSSILTLLKYSTSFNEVI